MNTSVFFDYPTLETDNAASGLAFLAEWSHAQWSKFFDRCQTLRYGHGDVLMAQNAAESAFFLVSFGQFEVLAPYTRGQRPRRINLIATGSVIGEQTFLDGQPNATEVRAVGEAEALRFSREAFDVLAAREPEMARAILFDLGRLLSLRLRAMTAQIYRA
ncbi:MAG: cyclic nucleotide-binding domain-containing protein [Caldilineaceae bacterium]